MQTDKNIARLVGLLILTAYSIVGSNNPQARILGMLLEIISGLSVIGIALLMYPYLKPAGTQIARCYLGLKILEGSMAMIAGVLFAIHQPTLLALRTQLYQLHAYVFAVPALLFYYLLYQTRLVPTWLAIWGMLAAVLLIVANMLKVADIMQTIDLLYLPIVMNEFVLALWLLVKGFRKPAG